MKKTYMIPALTTTLVDQCLPIAESNQTLSINRTEKVGAADIEVKSSRQDYNVWNDDWSE